MEKAKGDRLESERSRNGLGHGIVRSLKKIPAANFLLPLLLGMLIHTFAPAILAIGSFTTALFSSAGSATLLGLQLLCLGAQLRFRNLSGIVRRGGTLILSKFAAGLLAALIFRFVLSNGTLLGISALSAIAAVSNINGSIYLSTMTSAAEMDYMASTPIVALTNGPFLTLLILGIAGLGEIPLAGLMATLLPMAIGFVIGNVSKRAAVFLYPGISLLLPFIGFSLGAGIDLMEALRGGLSGIMLAVMVLLLGGAISIALDRILNKGDGIAGVAVSATGANAAGVPAAVALVSPAWQAAASEATAQVTACIVISAIVVPVAAVAWKRKTAKRAIERP